MRDGIGVYLHAEATAPRYSINPGITGQVGVFAVLHVGPLSLHIHDPTELRRLADVAANAADVLEQSQAEARRSQRQRVKECPVPHEAIKLSSHWPVLPFVGYQDDGAGGQLELRTCDCGTTLAKQMEPAEGAGLARVAG